MRKAGLFLGMLLLMGVTDQALAQDAKKETLIVVRDGHGATRMTVYWKDNPDRDNRKEDLIGVSQLNLSIPRRYFVGTETQSGRVSMHTWKFDVGFVEKAGVGSGLRLARKLDQNDCLNSKALIQAGSDYDWRSSVPRLLSAVIEFGHVYEVCRKKGMDRSATVAGEIVDRLHKTLKDKLPRIFTGEMCRPDRLTQACG